jgi:hypothetical protein
MADSTEPDREQRERKGIESEPDQELEQILHVTHSAPSTRMTPKPRPEEVRRRWLRASQPLARPMTIAPRAPMP